MNKFWEFLRFCGILGFRTERVPEHIYGGDVQPLINVGGQLTLINIKSKRPFNTEGSSHLILSMGKQLFNTEGKLVF